MVHQEEHLAKIAPVYQKCHTFTHGPVQSH